MKTIKTILALTALTVGLSAHAAFTLNCEVNMGGKASFNFLMKVDKDAGTAKMHRKNDNSLWDYELTKSYDAYKFNRESKLGASSEFVLDRTNLKMTAIGRSTKGAEVSGAGKCELAK